MRAPASAVLGRTFGGLVIAAVVLAGCSSGSTRQSGVPQTSTPSKTHVSASTTTTTTPPVGPAAQGEASELRAKLVEQGICRSLTNFTPFLRIPVTSLLNCEDGYGIFVFPSSTERDQVIYIIAGARCTAATFLAVSEKWIVLPSPATQTRAGSVAAILGGEVRELPCGPG